ncbi:cell death regulator Aven isoform X2 [Chaetodon auriga]|uniref:cell death regulator Aven isoform X2 n=1 Tax=Chaetodon auriga TaxID=39042 RepID=UPI00403295A8
MKQGGAGGGVDVGVSSGSDAADCLPFHRQRFQLCVSIRGNAFTQLRAPQTASHVPRQGGVADPDEFDRVPSLKQGDSFAQFRFSEEKDWEMNSFAASQMSAVFVDLPALAQSLQQVPLHQRLNLEAELVQVSTPVELPTATLAPKQEKPKPAAFTPPPAALNALSTNQKVPVDTNPVLVSDPQVSSTAAESPPVDDDDEELDQLLSLQKPVLGVSVAEECVVPEEACEEVKEAMEEKLEVKEKDATPAQSASVRKEVTEEELEDWLDSMIS